MSCYFNSDNTLIMRRGDTATFTIESDDIPFEDYNTAYFAIVDLTTLLPVIPELSVATTSERKVTFSISAATTETLPQPTEPYATYGYTFKLCTSAGVEDTFIPTVEECSSNTQNLVVKKIPKVHLYPKVIEGVVPPATNE